MLHIIPQILVTFVLIVSGLFIDVRMTLISLILLPFSIWGIQKLGNTAYKNQKVANTYWDSLFNRIVDTFTNLKVIRLEKDMKLIFSKNGLLEHVMRSIVSENFG